jgi:electron transfer flavoprotein beta subunit
VKITVLIAGVHDPKWKVALANAQLPEAEPDRQIMSPFDEAALEMALRVRDANPATLIHVHVAGGDTGAKIARTVAAFNPAEVSMIEVATPWDQSAVANALVQLCGDADLILIGREFGDYDDGLVPPILAAKLSAPFFGRAQVIETKDGLRLMREVCWYEERCHVSERLVASVTNDRRTRLRKPLMKNVMLARQAVICLTQTSSIPSPGLELVGTTERSSSRAATTCTMIQGTSEHQAQALATILLAARA